MARLNWWAFVLVLVTSAAIFGIIVYTSDDRNSGPLLFCVVELMVVSEIAGQKKVCKPNAQKNSVPSQASVKS